MIRDTNLGQPQAIKAIKNSAASAYTVEQQPFNRHTSAQDSLNRAYDARQHAFGEQEKARQRLQQVRDANEPRIESLSSQQQLAYQDMRRALEAASSSCDAGDEASAEGYAEEGQRFKAKSQSYALRCHQLDEEIRSARSEYDAAKRLFRQAEDDLAMAECRFNAEKATHVHAQEAPG